MIKTIQYRSINFCYNVVGEGYPVVLMHGWGCNSSTLASISDILVPGFKVINVDFPGFGNSDEPNEIWNTFDYEQAIHQLIRMEGITVPPIMIGHSFGGRVGIIYASHHDVHKLILIDAAGIKPKRSLKYYFKVYSYKLVKKIMLVFGKFGKRMLDRYRTKAGSSDYNNASPKMRAIMSKVVNDDLKHLMPQIKAPTLLVWGENDTATPVRDAKTMENLIPNAGLVVFKGCSHYSFLDNPIQFKAVLNSFLDDDRNKSL